MRAQHGHAYQASYAAGLRVLDTAGLSSRNPYLAEAGFFDVYPPHDDAGYVGAWSAFANYVRPPPSVGLPMHVYVDTP